MADSELAAWRPSVVIGSSYVAQGVVAYVGAMMIAELVRLDTPLEDYVVVLVGGASPWVLKFVFALLLDLGPSWSLRVRSLVSIVLLGGTAAMMWGLARTWAPGVPDSLVALGLAWLTLNLAMAMQDTLVDALAIDVMADHRALAATLMSLGLMLATALLGPKWIYPAVDESGLATGLELAAIAIAVIALTPALLWVPGRPLKARERPSARQERAPSDWLWLLAVPLLGALTMLAPSVTDALGAEFVFNEAGWDQADYMTQVIPIGAIGGFIGVLVAGPAVARLGPIWASAGAALLLGAATLIFASLAAHWTDLWPNRAMAFPEGFLQPAMLVGLHALALLAAARSPLPIAGFVLVMAALNLPRVIGPLIAPSLLEHGWVAVFAGCGAVQILAALGLALLVRRANGSSNPEQRGVR